MDIIIAVIVWLLVLVQPTAFDDVAHLSPCLMYEDGSTICETFTLPAYDNVDPGWRDR